MFLDSDKIDSVHPEQCKLLANKTDSSRGTLIIEPSPQGGKHEEPILRMSHILRAFTHFDRQPIDTELQRLIDEIKEQIKIPTQFALMYKIDITKWNKYIECISFIHLIKK